MFHVKNWGGLGNIKNRQTESVREVWSFQSMISDLLIPFDSRGLFLTWPRSWSKVETLLWAFNNLCVLQMTRNAKICWASRLGENVCRWELESHLPLSSLWRSRWQSLELTQFDKFYPETQASFSSIGLGQHSLGPSWRNRDRVMQSRVVVLWHSVSCSQISFPFKEIFSPGALRTRTLITISASVDIFGKMKKNVNLSFLDLKYCCQDSQLSTVSFN